MTNSTLTATTTRTRLPETRVVSAWKIDPSHTLVEFSVKHLMISTVRGRFVEVEGTIVMDEENRRASSVEVEIGAASIDTREARRDEHLRSPDFLAAAEFPKLVFTSTAVEGDAREGWRVRGDLTIRGATRPVVLDVVEGGSLTDPWGNERRGFSATTTIDRRDFGLTWNQALESGGVLVGNEVRVSLEVEAVRQ